MDIHSNLVINGYTDGGGWISIVIHRDLNREGYLRDVWLSVGDLWISISTWLSADSLTEGAQDIC